jgi:hypothetical protein
MMTVHKILFASLPVIVLGLGACEDKAVEKAKE